MPVAHLNNPVWEILICTLEKRKESFNFLLNKLSLQISENCLQNFVKISFSSDSGKMSIGEKRNLLLFNSKCDYLNFIDDDDDVSNDYVYFIYSKLKLNKDCISLVGKMTTNGLFEKKFVHSIKYKSYFEDKGVYYRPPNHLNPIKREIAVQQSFPEKNFGEDTDWAIEMCSKNLLKTEVEVEKIYYFYKYVTEK
jgi:hypothetical protein